MKKITNYLMFYGLLLVYTSALGQNRSVQDFNSSWKFCLCDAANTQNTGFNDASWTSVSTPHTWNGTDGQDGGNNYVRGIGWYRKHFNASNTLTGKKVFLRFGSANMRTDVYVNGTLAGNHTGGYSAFTFDITNMINIGSDNVIAVKVNNMDTIKAAPLDADFTFFGGISKKVELIVTDKVHITPLDYSSPGVYITQDNVSASSADIYIKALVKNARTTSASITAHYYIINAAGATIKTLNTTQTLSGGQQKDFTTFTNIANPTLWNGLSNPYLYSVKTQIEVDGSIVDEIIQPLGIRYYTANATQGFFLNGSSYRLHGVAHHEDRIDKGRAISDQDRKQDLDILKEMGCNYIRLSHYQHGQYTYNYCDSNGILTWTEIPLIDKVDGSATFTANTKQQLIELIRQNYNHPSVIVWSLSNEITYKAGPDPSSLVQQLNTLAKQEDSTRLTASAAMNTNAALNFYSDIYSCNVYNGWYYNTYNDFGTWADNQRTGHPSNPLGVSEYGAGANVEQHEPLNPLEPLNYGAWHPEEYQALFHEAHWQQILARPYLWSTSIWVAFDFASDGRGEGLQPGINDKGMITRDRATKKDAYYFYKANWSNDPFVYITSRRFTLRYDSVLTAKTYSNCDSVKLKINNVQLVTKTSTNHIYQWTNVQLVRGSNMITSIGYKNGVAYYDTCYWQFNGPYKIVVAPGEIQVNFEASATVTPAGYLKDFGSIYGDRGNGHTYGWNQSITTYGRERNVESPKTFDTFIHMQYNNGYNYWEIALPEGYYKVSIVAGDPGYSDSYNAISAEDKLIIKEPVYAAKRHAFGTDTVFVSDGKLTIKPATSKGASNSKIDFIHISSVTVEPPVTGVKPSNSQLDFLVFPNPASSELTIAPLKEASNIRILDATGNVVRTYTSGQTDAFTIPTSDLRKGIYFLEVISNNKRATTKFFIEQ